MPGLDPRTDKVGKCPTNSRGGWVLPELTDILAFYWRFCGKKKKFHKGVKRKKCYFRCHGNKINNSFAIMSILKIP